jgi:hypothetical protein
MADEFDEFEENEQAAEEEYDTSESDYLDDGLVSIHSYDGLIRKRLITGPQRKISRLRLNIIETCIQSRGIA